MEKQFRKVVNIINQNKKHYKSVMQMLMDYFTQNTIILPQSLPHYKFNVNDTVKINAFPTQRRNLGFKYSLDIGQLSPFPRPPKN
jgi:hypothetical protein